MLAMDDQSDPFAIHFQSNEQQEGKKAFVPTCFFDPFRCSECNKMSGFA